MNDEFYYLDEGYVKITAASVGICSKRWICINEHEVKNNNYKDIMKQNRFDVLPIITNDDKKFEFFKTDQPSNYNNISRFTISEADKIPLDTDIRQVINKFIDEKRIYYFLTNENRITGLISIGNLNCKQVQIYIFSKFCDLERRLSEFINHNIENEKIKLYLKDKAKKNDKFKALLYNYQELVSLGLENSITEHLFLVDFFDIIKKFSLQGTLGFSIRQWDDIMGINELRNLVAHPTRSLLDRENNIAKLDNRLKIVDGLIDKLKEFEKKNTN